MITLLSKFRSISMPGKLGLATVMLVFLSLAVNLGFAKPASATDAYHWVSCNTATYWYNFGGNGNNNHFGAGGFCLMGGGSKLYFQPDGNLVFYGPDGKARWSSRTWGRPNATLVLQNDGNIVIYNNYKPIYASGTYRGAPGMPVGTNLDWGRRTLIVHNSPIGPSCIFHRVCSGDLGLFVNIENSLEHYTWLTSFRWDV